MENKKVEREMGKIKRGEGDRENKKRESDRDEVHGVKRTNGEREREEMGRKGQWRRR